MVWCDGNSHHPVVCEVQEGKEAHKEEPEELFHFPFKAHHGIHYERVICSLEEHERYFGKNLQLNMQLAKHKVYKK